MASMSACRLLPLPEISTPTRSDGRGGSMASPRGGLRCETFHSKLCWLLYVIPAEPLYPPARDPRHSALCRYGDAAFAVYQRGTASWPLSEPVHSGRESWSRTYP